MNHQRFPRKLVFLHSMMTGVSQGSSTPTGNKCSLKIAAASGDRHKKGKRCVLHC